MNRPFRFATRAVEILALVLVGMSPFVVYAGLKVAKPKAELGWPADVALVASSGGELRDLAILHWAPDGPSAARIPIQAELDIPNMGTLRAVSAYPIGGASALAHGLADTLGLPVPYTVEWQGTSTTAFQGRATENLGAHAPDVGRVLADLATGRLPIVPAPGSWSKQGDIPFFTMNADAMVAILNHQAPPTPTPSPTPSPTGHRVKVEVLNQGAAPGAAKQLADLLKSKGFEVTYGNSPRADIVGVVVYWLSGSSDGKDVADALGDQVVRVAEMPRGYVRTSAEVVVLVGRAPRSNGGASSSPSPTPSHT